MPGVLLCCSAYQAYRGDPPAGVLLCRLAHQALKGAPWVGSCSVVQSVRHLMGQPLYCSAPEAVQRGGAREAMVMAPPPKHDSAVLPCFHGCLTFLHRHFHQNLLPHIPSVHVSTDNSSLRPGIAPQSLNSSSQPLGFSGDQRSCPVYVWLLQGLSDSHSI